MDRWLQGTPATPTVLFTANGVAKDPSPITVTVVIKRADGTTLTSGTATRTGTGAYKFDLNVTQTADLDTLTATWTSTNLGSLRTQHEIVGGFLFSLAEARRMDGLQSSDRYSDSAILAMRTTVEQAIEDAAGVAFVPRYALEVMAYERTGTIVPRWPYVRAVRALSIGGTAVTTSDVLTLPVGIYYPYYTGTFAYTPTALLSYEHGYDYPPERIRRAALILLRAWILNGPTDDRAAVFNAGADGGTYSLVVPGRNGSEMGLPEVDQAIRTYSFRVPMI